MTSYTPERWSQLSDLLGEVLLRPKAEREAYVAEVCAGDDALRADLEHLLEAYEEAESTDRFERGALDFVPLAFPESDPPPVLGPYRLVKEVGRGGMGTVWMAERADGVYERRVAVKMMRAGFLPEDARRRFEAERRILARLDHPNIARILDGGVGEGGQPYLVMEYVEGVPITDFCRANALDVKQRINLFIGVCRTVADAHQKLVVHRDLKPTNIFITEAGEVKLLDFGIAKLLEEDGTVGDAVPITRPGMSLMTPDYAAPEQVTGGQITTATDVYSLGIVLFELLTGDRPYRVGALTPSAMEHVVCHEEPTRPSTVVREGVADGGFSVAPDRLAKSLRGDLDTIVLKALKKEPERRYGSAEQLAEDLRRYQRGLPISTRPDTLTYRAKKMVRRHRKMVIAAAAVFLTLLGGIVTTTWQASIAERERARAERRFADVRQLAGTFLFEFHDAIRDLPGATPARELVVDRALQYLATLARESEGDPSLQLELAMAYRSVGDVQGNPTNANLGRTGDALESYRTAIAILENSEAPAEDRLLQLSLTRERLADVQAAEGDLDAAASSFQRAVSGYQSLVGENPDDLEGRVRYAVGLIKQGDLFGNPNFPNRGDASAALSNYLAARPILENAYTADTTYARAYRLLGLIEERLGTIYDLMDRHSEASEAFRRSLQIRSDYLATRPNDLDATRDLAVAHEKMGLAASASGDLDEAARRHRLASDVFRRLLAADSQNVQAWHSVARSLMHEGDVAALSAQAGTIPSQYREAQRLLDELSETDRANNRTADLTERAQTRMAAAARGEEPPSPP